MSKIRNFLLILVLVYFAGMFAYNATVGSRLKKSLSPQYGETLTVKTVKLTDWYLQNGIRSGEAAISYSLVKDMGDGTKRNEGRGLDVRELTVPVTVTGKWWPKDVHAGSSATVGRR